MPPWLTIQAPLGTAVLGIAIFILGGAMLWVAAAKGSTRLLRLAVATELAGMGLMAAERLALFAIPMFALSTVFVMAGFRRDDRTKRMRS